MTAPLAETVEREVEVAESSHRFRRWFSEMKLSGIADTAARAQYQYDAEQNSLRALRRDLSVIARRYGFDPTTGEYVNAFDVAVH